MAAVNITDFSDIYTAVMEELKIPTSDTTTLSRVKRNINMVYQNLVAPHTEWPWLLKRTDVVHPKYHAAGASTTVSVTEDSTTVTLSAAPAAALGSFKNYFFQTTDGGTVYTISAHTANSATITLSVAYQEDTNATAAFKIWTDKVALPTDARQITGMRHDRSSRDVIPKGTQMLDEIVQRDRSTVDVPKFYAQDDFYDSNSPEVEATRYRQVRIYPAAYDKDQVLHIDYVQDVIALDADGDEPAMPIEDRVILVYGALMQSWIRDRNPETATINKQLFDQKLKKMAARLTQERPRFEVDSVYMNSRRKSRGIISR